MLRESVARSFPKGVHSSMELDSVFSSLDDAQRKKMMWLVLYILNGALPTQRELEDAETSVHIDGASEWFRRRIGAEISRPHVRFEIIEGATLVDVFHTSTTGLKTGIQRVVSETVIRWARLHEITLVAWDDNWERLRRLNRHELSLFGLNGETGFGTPEDLALIPIDCHYLMVELVADPPRTSRLSAMVDAGAASLDAIVYDCVPISSSETAAQGMPYAFANYLNLLSRAKTLVPISDSAATEYRGWKQMISSVGLHGPEIQPVDLAAEVTRPDQADVQSWLNSQGFNPEIPLITCVGSNEPRKNQLAVLRSMEQLWLGGHEFELLFVGGNSWNDAAFTSRIRDLQERGFPVYRRSRLSDDELYRAVAGSTFTVFPSLNEGFGLPVAESLLLGTPVITSRFGSTAQIADGNGGVLIDPRSDGEIFSASRSLLTEPDRLRSLRDEASLFHWKTWDQYAEETWGAIHALMDSP